MAFPRVIVALTLALLALVLAACGGDEEEGGGEPTAFLEQADQICV